jgi:hypothetical protein
MIMHLTQTPVKSNILTMNGFEIRERIAELKVQMAAIIKAENRQKLNNNNPGMKKANHVAHLDQLEQIKRELESFLTERKSR